MITATIDWDNRELSIKESPKPAHPHGLKLSVNLAGNIFSGNNMAFKLAIASIALISLAPTALSGIPEPVENVRYESSDPSVATVDAAGNVTGVAVGTAQITVIADAHIGAGDNIISEVVEVQVMEPEAVHLNATIALAESQPVAQAAVPNAPDAGSEEGTTETTTSTETAQA